MKRVPGEWVRLGVLTVISRKPFIGDWGSTSKYGHAHGPLERILSSHRYAKYLYHKVQLVCTHDHHLQLPAIPYYLSGKFAQRLTLLILCRFSITLTACEQRSNLNRSGIGNLIDRLCTSQTECLSHISHMFQRINSLSVSPYLRLQMYHCKTLPITNELERASFWQLHYHYSLLPMQTLFSIIYHFFLYFIYQHTPIDKSGIWLYAQNASLGLDEATLEMKLNRTGSFLQISFYRKATWDERHSFLTVKWIPWATIYIIQ